MASVKCTICGKLHTGRYLICDSCIKERNLTAKEAEEMGKLYARSAEDSSNKSKEPDYASIYGKEKWYEDTAIICCLFFFWCLIIPPIIGAFLLNNKIKKEKKRREAFDHLKKKNEYYDSIMTPELQDAFNLQRFVDDLRIDQKLSQEKLLELNTEIDELDLMISKKKKEVVILDEEILVQEFGLYKPIYDFANALEYKDRLTDIRSEQKSLIKEDHAVTGNTNWTVNGSVKEGQKMVRDMKKLLLRAFNNECDDIIAKVRYTNYDASLKRIEKSAEAISKLGKIVHVSITKEYLRSKITELQLAFEYRQKKQEEKEAAKAARAEQRELERVQKEIEAEKKKIEKEQSHYQSAYEKLLEQLSSNPNDPELKNKQKEFEEKLLDINKALTDIDYRQANMRAGYVYVISNIGSFGENVYKIGMTRRLNPQDRVDELGDASVPFRFDVHAMIFSDDAPALENALHKAFEDKKINMVNQRREFFHVTLDEIKDVVRANFDKTVEFIDVPDAEQYRVSLKMKDKSISADMSNNIV